MAFHDTLFPTDISYGFEAGPTASTIIQRTSSGHEYRATRQSQMPRRFRASRELLTNEQWSEVLDFVIGRRGALHGFRFKDWSDYSTAEDGVASPAFNDAIIGSGDGTTTQFQILKTYDAAGPAPYARKLAHPVTNTVSVGINGVDQSSGWTVNSSGVVTFTIPPAQGDVVTAGCEFHVPVRLAESTESWMSGAYQSHERLSWSSFELVEVLDMDLQAETWWPGGSAGTNAANGWLPISATMTINSLTHVWPMEPVGANQTLILPPPDTYAGGVVFHILCRSGTYNVDVVDHLNQSIATVSAGTAKRILLLRTATTAYWVAS
jgi:uncharacterized protein (TIGR02217 family)